jgi:hypothetical protein
MCRFMGTLGWLLSLVTMIGCETYGIILNDTSMQKKDGYAATAAQIPSSPLDNSDMNLMANGLNRLGYHLQVFNDDVTAPELTAALGKTIDLLYHTGHGESGQVLTPSGNVVLSTVKINVKNTILATCSTLADTALKTAMGPSADVVMGYTDSSYDDLDNLVVEQYLKEIESGKKHLQAWYLSNVSHVRLSDRWISYARDNATTSVVEYSARLNQVPRSVLNVDWLSLKGAATVRVARSLMEAPAGFVRTPAIVDVLDPEEVQTEFFRDSFPKESVGALSGAQAAAIAEKWLLQRDLLPADAELEQTIPIRADDGSGPTISGYTLIYGRKLDGLPVLGNRVTHHIAVAVDSESVFSISRYWPKLAQGKGAATEPPVFLPLGEAINRSADRIGSILKGKSIDLVESRPAYGIRTTAEGARLVPAYALTGTNGATFVVDAVSGDLL